MTTAFTADKAAADGLVWEAIQAQDWALAAVDGNFYQYHCPDVAANLVIEFNAPDGNSEWAEIVYAYYTDSTGAEWEHWA